MTIATITAQRRKSRELSTLIHLIGSLSALCILGSQLAVGQACSSLPFAAVADLFKAHALLGAYTSQGIPFGSTQTATGATKTTPFVLYFGSGQTFYIQLQRPTKFFSAPFRLRIYSLVPLESNTYELRCEVTGVLGKAIPTSPSTPYVSPPIYSVVSPNPMFQYWRVEIYDDGDGGPTGDSPYALNYNIYYPAPPTQAQDTRHPAPVAQIQDAPHLVAPGVTLNDVVSPFLSDSIPPACQLTTGVVHSGGQLQKLVSESWPRKASESSYVQFIDAGRRVYVRLAESHPNETEHKITVKLFFKTKDTGKFTQACESALGGNSSGVREHYIVAHHDLPDPLHTTWKLEITATASSSNAGPFLAVDTFREYDPETYGAIAKLLTPDADQYLCLAANEGSSYGPALSKAAEGFLKNPVLKIKITDDDKMLSQEGLRMMRLDIVEAIQLWNRGCRGCAYGNNLVVQVGDSAFVSSVLADTLREWDNTASPRFLLSSPTVKDALQLALTWRGPGVNYELTPPNSHIVDILCKAQLTELPDPIIAVRSFFRCDSSTFDATRLELKVLNGFTSCGRDPNIIACGKSGKEVEFNANQFVFVSRSPTVPIFGQGSTGVDFFLVILHEVGHWVGLPHLDSPVGIMSRFLNQLECIDDRTAEAMFEIARSGSKAEGRDWPLLYRSPN